MEQEEPQGILDRLPKWGEIKWLWVVAEIEIETPDHECTPDCSHWRDNADTSKEARL